MKTTVWRSSAGKKILLAMWDVQNCFLFSDSLRHLETVIGQNTWVIWQQCRTCILKFWLIKTVFFPSSFWRERERERGVLLKALLVSDNSDESLPSVASVICILIVCNSLLLWPGLARPDMLLNTTDLDFARKDYAIARIILAVVKVGPAQWFPWILHFHINN